MDLSAPSPFDLVILDRATANFMSKRSYVSSSTEGGFSSSSSNGSVLGASPPPPSKSLQKSSSEMNVKQILDPKVNRIPRNSSCDSEFWLRVVPSCKIRPRDCDEVPEEFKRAGIGLCFGGM